MVWRKLALVVFTIVLSLGMAELVLRLVDYPPDLYFPWKSDPYQAYRYAPDLRQRMVHSEFDILFETNSLGYRDQGQKPKSGPRVVLVGDSFVAGQGVASEHMFANLFEEQLGVEVLNRGVGGHELVHQVHLLRTDAFKELDADLIVHMIFLGNDLVANDPWQEGPGNTLKHESVPFPEYKPAGPKLEQLWKVAKFNRSRKGVAAGKPWLPGKNELSICTENPEPVGIKHYATSKKFLEQIMEEAGDRYFPVFFGYVHMVDEKKAQKLKGEELDLSAPERALAAFFEEKKQPYLNLNPKLREAQQKEQLYYHSDVHWNPAGHKVVADALTPAVLEQLRSRGLLPNTP